MSSEDVAPAGQVASITEPVAEVSSTPPAPPKSYTNAYVAPPSLPPAYRPNTSVPDFIRLLAYVFLLAGCTSAGLTWVYKKVIYPRLTITVDIISRLTAGNVTTYDKLLSQLQSVSKAPGYARIIPPAPEPELLPPALPTGSDSGASPSSSSSELPLPLIPKPVNLFLPITASLASLSAFVLPLKAAPSSSTRATGPNQDLSKSLSTLNEYISTQSYASVSSAYRSYGLASSASVVGSAGAGGNKSLLEAVSAFKVEVRAVKGALLNRRNFAAMAPRSEVA